MSDIEVCKEQRAPIWVKSVYFEQPLKAVGSYYYGNQIQLIYSNLLNRLALWIKAKIEKDNQVMISISGATSSGKSTLAICLIKELCALFNWAFDFNDTYIYSPKDLANKLKRKCENRINWFDEGSVSMDSLATASKVGRLFNNFFNTMRLRHYITIICCPDDEELSKRIMKHADLYIECPSKSPLPPQFKFQARGFFYVSYKIRYGSGKTWEQRIGTGTYKKLPKKLKDEYEAIKKLHNYDFEDEFIKGVLNE